MRWPLLLAAVSLAGCWAPPMGETPFVYEADCLAFLSEKPLDEDALLNNVAVARAVLSERPIVPAAHFCEAFSATAIHIHDEPSWAGARHDGGDLYGWSTVSGVYLGSSMHAFVHELLHVWDSRHWVMNSGSHAGWDENGYNAAQRAYVEGRVIP